ncbi:MAG: hypothetical protein EPO10_11780 [Reyranella sp.]|nr:MAG: hypothetical protein EPO10_11780 [Reyranella sp.]
MSKRLDQESKAVESNAQIPDLMWRACPPQRHDNRKSWLVRVARALDWKPRRVKALFYCEARVVTADEWRTLNQRLDALKAAERRHQEQTDELREAYRAAREDRVVAGGSAVAVCGTPPRSRDA